jgi:hypothetical protein
VVDLRCVEDGRARRRDLQVTAGSAGDGSGLVGERRQRRSGGGARPARVPAGLREMGKMTGSEREDWLGERNCTVCPHLAVAVQRKYKEIHLLQIRG